jgi:hypothetical protein
VIGATAPDRICTGLLLREQGGSSGVLPAKSPRCKERIVEKIDERSKIQSLIIVFPMPDLCGKASCKQGFAHISVRTLGGVSIS